MQHAAYRMHPQLTVSPALMCACPQCLDRFLPADADLVFLEFVANDGSEMDGSLEDSEKTRSFERLMRQVLGSPSAPAVVMMQVRGCIAGVSLGPVLFRGGGAHV